MNRKFWMAVVVVLLLVTVGSAVFAAPLAPTPGWSNPINITNTTFYFYNQSIAAGKNGQVYVVAVDNSANVYFQIWNGSSWSSASIVGTGVLGQHGLASEESGSAHLVYTSSTAGVMYRRYDGTTWASEILITNQTDTQYAAVAADPSGYPHVVWDRYDNPTGKNQIYYSRWNGAGWTSPTLLSPNGARPRIGIDGSGTVHVVWYVFPTQQLYYAKWNGSWTSPIVLSTGVVGSPDVTACSSGNVHVVWDGGNNIFYTQWNGSSWSSPVDVSLGVYDGGNPFIACDTSGNVHLVWEQVIGGRQIRYRRQSAGAWSIVNSLSTNSNPWFAVLAADAGGRVYVAWQDEDAATRRQVFFTNAPWYVGAYSISGRITEPGETAIPGVTVSAGPGATTTTDTNGNYTLNGLSNNNTYWTLAKNHSA